MTRTIRFHQLGGPDVLQIESLDVGQPGPGEIRIRVETIGLNRAEASFRAGRYLETPVLPARLGYEAAGIVDLGDVFVVPQLLHDDMLSEPQLRATRRALYPHHAEAGLPVSPKHECYLPIQPLAEEIAYQPSFRPIKISAPAWPEALRGVEYLFAYYDIACRRVPSGTPWHCVVFASSCFVSASS